LRAALAAAQAVPESEWPERTRSDRRKRDRDFERKVDILLKAREQTAAKLDIDGSLIAPRAVLEALAAGDAEPAEVLLDWQRECFGSHL
jgi:ribonuclease D